MTTEQADQHYAYAYRGEVASIRYSRHAAYVPGVLLDVWVLLTDGKAVQIHPDGTVEESW
jgi:hypothetical protein